MSSPVLSFVYRITTVWSRRREWLTFGVALLLVLSLDRLFNGVYHHWPMLFRWVPSLSSGGSVLELSFAPEVWLSLIGLTLGTLVIVISIAAQTIPKIAELYMQDGISLLYIWYLMVAGTHALFLKLLRDAQIDCTASIILNLYVLLPIGLVLSFPYIFYVLKSIQPATVIKKVFHAQRRLIRDLCQYPIRDLLGLSAFREAYQYRLLESLNQFENLLEYVTSKETKAQIIQNISLLLHEFIVVKQRLQATFFEIGPTVRADISFKTMIDQFEAVEQSHTFYEQKCFRLLGNTYVHLLEDAAFDLASLCASEMSKVGMTAVRVNDDNLLDAIVIRFNTLCRFALKHGVKHNEARNLYNLAFHYRTFIEHLVRNHKTDQSLKSFLYLRRYGNEAFGYGRASPAMYFIVDVIAAEMKKILILVHVQGWPHLTQKQLLSEMLKVDSPPEVDEESPDQPHLNSGVRTLQIGLALFYLTVERKDFVAFIIEDLLDDLKVLGKPAFQLAIQRTCDRIRTSQPTFWEDTDRGNTNIYHCPHADQLEAFCWMLDVAMAADESGNITHSAQS